MRLHLCLTDNQDYPKDLHILKFRLFLKRVFFCGRTHMLNKMKLIIKYRDSLWEIFLQGSSLSSYELDLNIYPIYKDGYVSICQNYFRDKIRLKINSCK